MPDDDLTASQLAAAQRLARETLQADRLAIERYHSHAVPRQEPDGQQREEGSDDR